MKKGLSPVIAVVLLILFFVVVAGIFISVFMPAIGDDAARGDAKIELEKESMEIGNVDVDESSDSVSFTVRRGPSSLSKRKWTVSNPSGVEEEIMADIVLVVDRSGSMYQAGWGANVNSDVTVDEFEVVVSRGDYSPSTSFEVLPETEELLAELTWEREEEKVGSEGSEFVLNLINKPDGSPHVFSYPWRPSDAGNVVDPGRGEAGAENEYYSGISTNPQYISVENPVEGEWEFAVYGWNFRPKEDPLENQNVMVRIYQGTAEGIEREETIISMDATIDSLKGFVDKINFDEEDIRVSYVVFGSYALERIGFSNNPVEIKNAIEDSGKEGGTAINEGIDKAKEIFLDDFRDGAKRIMIVLTDGQNDAGPDIVIESAELAKGEDIIIYTIGLSSFVNKEMLMSSASKDEYFFHSLDASELSNVYDSVFESVTELVWSSVKEEEKEQFLQIVFTDVKGDTHIKYIEEGVPAGNEVESYNINLDDIEDDINMIEVYLGVWVGEKRVLSDRLAVWKR